MRVVTERPQKHTELFQIKGTPHTLLTLKLLDFGQNQSLFEALDDHVKKAPSLLLGAPIIVDLSELSLPEDFDLARLRSSLKAAGVAPVAVCGIDETLASRAAEADLPILAKPRPTRSEESSSSKGAPSNGEAQKPTTRPATLTLTEPVRSGRRVYARGDLVLLAPVSPGAEVMADGHIHVYGTLRGRALAGLNGDRSARIFCQSLQAELISIAGLYRVSEDIDRSLFKKSVQAYLDEDKLCIEELG